MIKKSLDKAVLDKLEFALNLKISDTQLDILETRGAPIVVVSGAGSGKTTLIISSICSRFLSAEFNFGGEIMVCTYTVAGKDELQSRWDSAREKLGLYGSKYNIEMKTIHSIFYRLLREFIWITPYETITPKFTVNKNSNLIKPIIYKTLNTGVTDEFVQSFISLMSLQIGYLYSDAQLEQTLEFRSMKNLNIQQYKQIRDEYSAYKEEHGLVDFDDMQFKLLQALEKDAQTGGKIIKLIREQWKYYYIDEYQDCSRIQQKIFSYIIGKPNNLFCIGDDDQSIYAWRGADVNIIRQMQIYLPNCVYKYLTQNYRCKANILNPIRNSIELNNDRLPKLIEAHNEGGKLELINIEQGNDLLCSKHIIADINKQVANGKTYFGDMAIIARNNKQMVYLTKELYNADIPFSVTEENMLFHRNQYVRDCYNLLCIIYNSDNVLKFKDIGWKLLIINKKLMSELTQVLEKSGFGIEFLDVLNKDLQMKLRSTAYNTYRELKRLILNKDNLSFETIVAEALKLYTETYINWRVSKVYGEYEWVIELINLFKDMCLKAKSFERIDLEFRIIDNKQENMEKIPNSIRLTTVHSSKGLEWDTVYLLNDSLGFYDLDSYFDLKLNFSEQIALQYWEQERRVHYVAWTRAKSRLVVTTSVNDESEFLKETGLLNSNNVFYENSDIIYKKILKEK